MGLSAKRLTTEQLQARLRNDCPTSQRSASDQVRTNQWTFDALRGVLTELSSQGGQGQLSLAFSLVLNAQRQKETVAWVTDSHSSFFPPDVAAAGIDLQALAVIRLPGVRNQLKGADRLVRSGGFGLVVLDLGADPRVPAALVARLAGLAKKHDTVVLCLTEKRRDTSSLGARVSVRGEAHRTSHHDGLYTCRINVFRDRRHGQGWVHEEVLRGPPGLG